jgi:hypothetical protein
MERRTSENLYMEDVFDPDVYGEISRRLPGDDVYQFIAGPGMMRVERHPWR